MRVSELAVSAALGRVGIRKTAADQPDSGETTAAGTGWAQDMLPGQDEPGAREQDVLPDAPPREAEQALAWFGVCGVERWRRRTGRLPDRRA